LDFCNVVFVKFLGCHDCLRGWSRDGRCKSATKNAWSMNFTNAHILASKYIPIRFRDIMAFPLRAPGIPISYYLW